MKRTILSLGIGMVVLGSAIPARATLWSLSATLTPGQEVPPHGTLATGTFSGTLDDVSGAISYTLIFTGLTSPALAAHIHGPATVGVNGPVFLPITVPSTTSATVLGSGVLTGTQSGWVTSGMSYVNVHDAEFPGGEIRGQIEAKSRAVPGPAALLPFVGGAVALWIRRRRR